MMLSSATVSSFGTQREFSFIQASNWPVIYEIGSCLHGLLIPPSKTEVEGGSELENHWDTTKKIHTDDRRKCVILVVLQCRN
jgi:hypothetical protein